MNVSCHVTIVSEKVLELISYFINYFLLLQDLSTAFHSFDIFTFFCNLQYFWYEDMGTL